MDYIKLSRKILEWEWYSDTNTKVLFLHMLLKANWKDGRFQGVEIPRGSFASSYQTLALETGLTVKNVRTSLEHLKKNGEVAVNRHTKFSVFTIKNYTKYQSTGSQPACDRQSTGSQPATIEEGKKERINISPNGDRAKSSIYTMIRELYNSVCGSYPRLVKMSDAKSDVCEICKALDGKHFKVKDMIPGVNAPPMHPFCHCSTAAWEDSKEYEEWLDFLDRGGTTAEWEKLKKKPIEKVADSGIINLKSANEESSVTEIRNLGKINIEVLEREFGKIQTDEIIVTNERIEHIKERHPEDYGLFEKYGVESVSSPDLIIKDIKHQGTVFMVKKLPETNLNVVVRVVLETDDSKLKNSVMTFYRIREKNLKKLIEKNGMLYKKE